MKDKDIEDLYELSPTQLGVLFHCLDADSAKGLYAIQMNCALRGDLEVSTFVRAWRRVIERTPVLRTSFHWEQLDTPLQVVHRDVELEFAQHDWSDLPSDEQETRFDRFLDKTLRRGFDPHHPPLTRFCLVKMSDGDYRFVWTFHYLILEGWSASLVLDDVFANYNAFCRGEQAPPLARRPFRDYILWLQGQDASKADEYWRRMLEGFTASTSLLLDEGMNGRQGEREYAEIHEELSASATEELQSLARKHRLTLNTLVQGAWALLLSRYSGANDVAFRTVASGRPASLPGADSMVGLFVQTLPVRARVPPQEGLIAWLERLQAEQLEAREYAYGAAATSRRSAVPRGLPLFESVLVFQNWVGDLARRDRATALELEDVGYRQRGTGNALTVGVRPGPQLSLTAAWDPRRLAPSAMARLLGHFRLVLEAMARKPESRLADLPLLTGEERDQLAKWNDTRAEYPRKACFPDLFEAQAARVPDAIAASFGEASLTYRELNERANQVAHHLCSLGAGPQARVAVLMERSLDMLVGVLGVLKAGAAYIPLDPSYPRERLSFILEDSQAPLVLTQQSLVEVLSESKATVVCLDAEAASLGSEGRGNPARQTTGEDLAYTIYTSGSTGRPKGVMVPHRALVNFLSSMGREPGLTERDVFLSVTTLSFDIIGLELYLPLMMGARVVLATQEEASDGVRLAERIVASGATIMQATPATWRLLLEAGWRGDGQLKILCGGDALGRDLADRLLKRGSSVWNLYGPTETTVWSTAWRVEPGEGPVLIGRPIANTQVYVLDSLLRPLPVGVPGELYVAGEGLAFGYHGRPELTAERFIPDPFSGKPGERLYKTGDLARYRPDGTLEWLGRLDRQLKIRGFRTEPAEIEEALRRHPGVESGVVVATESAPGETQLVGYVVPAAGVEPTVTELRSHLKGIVPASVVPSSFVFVDQLPLTPNGKIDHRAVEKLEGHRDHDEDADLAPRTPTERFLADVWQELLRVERVGLRDYFFDLGGHSLLAMRLIARVEKHLGRRLRHQDIIFQTLEQIAAMCDEDTTARQTREPSTRVTTEASNGPWPR